MYTYVPDNTHTYIYIHDVIYTFGYMHLKNPQVNTTFMVRVMATKPRLVMRGKRRCTSLGAGVRKMA